MVNTFLPYTNLDSVRLLDSKRLNKQISEALQILRVLRSLHAIAYHYNCQYTGGTLAEYIALLRKIHLQYEGKYYIYHNNDNMCIMSTNPIYMAGWQQVKLGFCFHPAVRMWFGYEQSLGFYINCCIHEFISRGGNHNFELRPYQHDVSNAVPPWLTEDFSQRHRGSLCSKQPEYYVRLFGNEVFYGYSWPVS